MFKKKERKSTFDTIHLRVEICWVLAQKVSQESFGKQATALICASMCTHAHDLHMVTVQDVVLIHK